MSTSFLTYWDLALASVDRQLVAATSAYSNPGLIREGSPVTLPLIRAMVDRAEPIQVRQDVHGNTLPPDPRESGHKIVSSEMHFRKTLNWLQNEICDLVSKLPATGFDAELSEILSVLQSSAEDIAERFGTLTDGWDRLVLLKHKLLLPDDTVLARSAWLVSLMADFERSLRDATSLPIECLGRVDFINRAAADTCADQCIEMRPQAILLHEKTDNAVAHAISEYMAQGVNATLDVTRCFAKHLGIMEFEGDSFKAGFHAEMNVLGSDSKAIIQRLVEIRRAVLHDTRLASTLSENSRVSRSNLSPLDSWDYSKLQVLAQFLYSYSIHYTLGVMDIVNRKLSADPMNEDRQYALSRIDEESAAVARYKASSELRVGTMALLQEGLLWLAGSLAEYLRERFEDGDGLMLRLNAAFAHSQLGIPEGWEKDVLKIEVDGKAPRYRLLKKCILQDWAGVDALIREALESKDMTLEELSQWPALAQLRRREEYRQAVSEFN